MKIRKVFIVLLAVLFSLPLVGCKEDELQKQIDGLTATIGQLNDTIDELNGKIDGLTTTNEELSDRIEELEWTHNAPYGFIYSLADFIKLWNFSETVSQEDLLNMAYYFNLGTHKNEDLMGENYQPKPLEEWDEETDRKIKETIIFYERYIYGTKSPWLVRSEDVYIHRNCGVYTWNDIKFFAIVYRLKGFLYADGAMDAAEIINGVAFDEPITIKIIMLSDQ